MVEQAEAVSRAEAQVRAYCGWWVAPTERLTYILDGPGTPLLILPSLKVVAIEEVRDTVLDELIPADGYTWAPGGVVYRHNGKRWPETPASIQVVAQSGYADWPGELRGVIDAVAARAMQAGSAVLTQVGSVSYATDSFGVPLGGVLQPSELALCNLYRLPRRP